MICTNNFKVVVIVVIVILFAGCSNKNLVYNDTSSYREEAINDLENSDYKSASVKFNEMLSYNLKNSDLQFLNALTYHLIAERGSFLEYQYAEAGYKLALKFDANNWLASKQLALLYLKTKKYRLAQKYAVETLLYRPKDTTMLYALAYSSYFLHDAELALCSLKEAYKLDKKDAMVLRGLIMTFSSIGNFKKAQNLLKKYSKLTKNLSDISYLKQRIYDKKYFYNSNTKRTKKDLKMKKVTLKENSEDDDINYKMVDINVVIIGVNQQINKKRGINLFDGLSFQFGKSLNTEASAITDNIMPENSSNTYSKIITTALSIPDIQYSLNIFNNNMENYSIIAKPTLVALNEHQSEYFSGDSMHIGLISTNDMSESEIVELPIGVKLIVTPKFLSKDKIQIDIEAQRTTMDETGDSGTFKSVIWTSKKNIHVNAVLEFGNTLIIGGLSERERQGSASETPLLANLPIVQYLFSNKSTVNWTRSDLILLTPRKVNIENKKKKKEQNKQSLLDDLKTIYPNWILKNKKINNNYTKREFRKNDFLYFRWNNQEYIKNILQNIYF